MADKAEENTEKDDKNDKNKDDEEEKAKKDDANEKLKTGTQERDKDTSNEPTDDPGTVADGQNQESENVSEEKPGDKTTAKVENTQKPAKTKQHKSNKDSKTKTEDKTKKVDLKLAQTHYQAHSRTTLPHILTEYGMEDKDHPKKEKKKRKKKKQEEKDDTDADDRLRRKAREEKFRGMFGDNREADTYYIEYIDFLEKKVQEQRQKAEKEREEQKRQAALREEEESEEEVEAKPAKPPSEQAVKVETSEKQLPPLDDQKQRHRLQKRLHRIELKHDDTFMKELPRTDISRIIALQDKMRREGKLKTQGEVDKFWRDIRKPDVFYAQFKVKPSDPGLEDPAHIPRYPELNTNVNSGADPGMAPRSLSHISESSRGEKGEGWAITQKFQSSNGPKSPTSQRKNSAQLAKEAALDLEKRCPKLEMPPLACFSLQLGEKPPDPDEIQKKVELRMREKSRKKTTRKLQRMYQMAMTNTAAANRILAQHNDLTSMFEGAALRDVLCVFDDPRLMGRRDTQQAPTSTAMEAYYYQQQELAAMYPSPPGSGSLGGSRQSSASSHHRLTPISDVSSHTTLKSRKSKQSSVEAIEYPAPIPVPLTLSEIGREKTVVEAKCVSTMWTNYMHAGKSAFAST